MKLIHNEHSLRARLCGRARDFKTKPAAPGAASSPAGRLSGGPLASGGAIRVVIVGLGRPTCCRAMVANGLAWPAHANARPSAIDHRPSAGRRPSPLQQPPPVGPRTRLEICSRPKRGRLSVPYRPASSLSVFIGRPCSIGAAALPADRAGWRQIN